MALIRGASVARPRAIARRLGGSGTTGLLFVLPTVVVLAAVLLVPILSAFYLGFLDASPTRSSWTGLANYQYLLEQPAFWNALLNTAEFTAASVTIHLALGLLAAVLVNEKIHGRSVVRVSLLVPWVIAPVIVGVTWKWIYDPVYGLLNSYLQQLQVIHQPTAWLASPGFAMPAVLMTNGWQGFPFMMVMLLAGLQGIPAEEYEAGMIDGASTWQRFLYITLPNLRYIILVGVTLDTIWQFRTFDVIQVMTLGGPMGATEVLSTLIYREMFSNFRFGLAAAIGSTMFAITTVLSLLYIGLIKDLTEADS